MARLDPLIESLLCENGSELHFESGSGVRLTLPSGPVMPIEKPLSTKQILASIAELAPASARAAIEANREASSFPYAHAKGTVTITVQPEGDRVIVRMAPKKDTEPAK